MPVAGRVAASALLALAALASAVVPAAPCLPDGGVSGLRAAIYGAAGLVCHQRPERSLSTCGRSWPVCGRCAGLYFGAGAIGLAAALRWRPRRNRVAWWRTAIAASAAPTLGLWLIEAAGLATVSTPARLVSAVPLGLAVGAWLTAVARGDLR